jgi:hypothetical protein
MKWKISHALNSIWWNNTIAINRSSIFREFLDMMQMNGKSQLKREEQPLSHSNVGFKKNQQ